MNLPFVDIFTILWDEWPSVKFKVVIQCLKDTHKQYGSNISQKEFDAMINFITKVENNILSMYGFEGNQIEIIKTLCELFPTFIDVKMIDSLVKCRFYSTYIPFIKNTGYEFTPSQINSLIKKGFKKIELIDTISYTEFLESIAVGHGESWRNDFENCCFDDDKHVLNKKVTPLKTIIDNNSFTVQDNLVMAIIKKCSEYEKHNIMIALNAHILARELGVKQFTEKNLENVLLHYDKKYAFQYAFSKTNPDERTIIVCKILQFYDKKPITRSMILKMETENWMECFLRPDMTDYEPINDIIFCHGLKQPNMTNHLFDNNYVKHDDFFSIVMLFNKSIICDVSTEPNPYLMKMIDDRKFNMCDLDAMFAFCDVPMLRLLLNIKIIPTKQQVLSITDHNVFRHYGDTLKIFTNADATLDNIIKSVDESSSNVRHFDNLEDSVDSVKIYDSLSERDKQIFIRLRKLKFDEIVRYDIKLTKQLVDYLISIGRWLDIAKLLYLSKEYDYVIDMIDDIFLSSPTYFSRLWLNNNIVMGKKNSFSSIERIPRKYVQIDVNELLAKPALIDIEKIRNKSLMEKCEKINKQFTCVITNTEDKCGDLDNHSDDNSD